MENVNEKVYEMCVCMDMLLNMRVCVCTGVDCFLKLRRYFIWVHYCNHASSERRLV